MEGVWVRKDSIFFNGLAVLSLSMLQYLGNTSWTCFFPCGEWRDHRSAVGDLEGLKQPIKILYWKKKKKEDLSLLSPFAL